MRLFSEKASSTHDFCGGRKMKTAPFTGVRLILAGWRLASLFVKPRQLVRRRPVLLFCHGY
jgi:hypothetical protein